MAKLFSGLSGIAQSEATTLTDVKWFVLPLTSAPIVDVDAVPTPTWSCRILNPLLPNVNPLVFLGIHTPFFVSPKFVGAYAWPSQKFTSDT